MGSDVHSELRRLAARARRRAAKEWPVGCEVKWDDAPKPLAGRVAGYIHNPWNGGVVLVVRLAGGNDPKPAKVGVSRVNKRKGP